MNSKSRREFLKYSLATASTVAGYHGTARPVVLKEHGDLRERSADRIRFGVIGLNHGHIYGQADAVIDGGGTLVSFYAKEADLAAAFSKRFPQAKQARTENEILEDSSIQLIVCASIPDERGPLAIRAMDHGKDVMLDKPGVVTLEQLAELRKTQSRTKRICSIFYSERLGNRATVRAGALAHSGAIGNVIQTIGLGPHRAGLNGRPTWFFNRSRYGGILCDIGSHQFDQFLYFTGSTKADIVAAQAGNTHHPEYPGLEDFGDAMVRGDHGNGYIRVDWFTPDGLGTWGDGRLTVLGTEGYIEIRKYIDLQGRPGGDHLFIVDQKGSRYLDCSSSPLPYGAQLVDDVLHRTETAMLQSNCFYAMELALHAQAAATSPAS